MNISYLKNKNIHFIECKDWHDVYGYEKSEMKEDIINYIEQLQQENKQLKDNWNKLKQIIDVKMYNSEYLINLCGYKVDVDTLEILKIIKEEMQELEKGDSNVEN